MEVGARAKRVIARAQTRGFMLWVAPVRRPVLSEVSKGNGLSARGY